MLQTSTFNQAHDQVIAHFIQNYYPLSSELDSLGFPGHSILTLQDALLSQHVLF